MRKAIAAGASAFALLLLVAMPAGFRSIPAWGAEAAGGGTLTDTEVRRFGFGVEQAFDSAGLLVYAQAHFYDPTVIGFPCGPAPFPPKGCGGDPKNTTKLPAEPWQGFVIGARIQF